MTAEVSAQAFAAIAILSFPIDVPADLVYDNETASRFSRSVSASSKSCKLSAVSAVLWQILSMHRKVAFYHTYSHCGEMLNEAADDLVALAAYNQADRQPQHVLPAV